MTVLSLLWWFALGALGVFFPFYSLYLRENAGLTGTQVGLVMATVPLVGLIAQPFWGQVADRSGRRGPTVGLLALGTGLGYASLLGADHFEGFLLRTAALAFFFTALVPGCVAVSLAALSSDDHVRFGRVRVMGTLGFAVSVGGFPFVLRAARARWPAWLGESSGAAIAEPGMQLIFVIAGVLAVAAAVTSLWLPKRGSISLRARSGEWRTLLHDTRFVRLVFFVFLTYLFSQGPMVLFPVLVRAQGGGIDAISQMWLLMLALEVPLVFYLGAGVSRFGPRGVIAVGICAGAVRWTISGFVDDLWWVYIAQLLHGVTVWGIILGVPIYIEAIVPPQLRSTGQALAAMVGVSLGSTLSNASAGWLVEALGPKAPAQFGGVASLVLALALPWILPPVTAHPRVESPHEVEA